MSVIELGLLALVWIGALSLVAFGAAAFDKARARSGGGRVPERVLLGLALVGGSPGLFLAMIFVRHKTKKLAFLLPFVLIVALQLAALWWFVLRR